MNMCKSVDVRSYELSITGTIRLCIYTCVYVHFEVRTGQNSERSGDRIPVGGEIFRTRPDRPSCLPSLLYSRYRVFPGSKSAGAWRWPPTPI